MTPPEDPRYSLANERTFLAWVRTALALMAGGVGVAHLVTEDDLPGGGWILGLPLVLLGALVAVLSYRRFLQAEEAMAEGRPLPDHGLVRFLAFAIAAVGVVAAVVALAGAPS